MTIADCSGREPALRKYEASTKPLFSMGQLVATPGSLKALQTFGVDPLTLVARHVCGDWGTLCEEDRTENELALREGFRIMSVYTLGSKVEGQSGEMKVWVITEANRASTTILLPEEY